MKRRSHLNMFMVVRGSLIYHYPTRTYKQRTALRPVYGSVSLRSLDLGWYMSAARGCRFVLEAPQYA